MSLLELEIGSAGGTETSMTDSVHSRFLKNFLPQENFLRGFLLASLGGGGNVEDLLQEVSVALWESYPRYDETRPFRAWALGVARNHLLMWRRKRARFPRQFSEEALLLLAERAERRAAEDPDGHPERLESCVQQLSETAREILEMRYVSELPVNEMARRLAKAEGAVEMALVRIRRALRECLERGRRSSVGVEA